MYMYIYIMYLIISALYFPLQLLSDIPPPLLTSFPLMLNLLSSSSSGVGLWEAVFHVPMPSQFVMLMTHKLL